MLRRLRNALFGELATQAQVEQVRQEVHDVGESVKGAQTQGEHDKRDSERFARDLRQRLDRLETQMNAIKPGSIQLRRINGE